VIVQGDNITVEESVIVSDDGDSVITSFVDWVSIVISGGILTVSPQILAGVFSILYAW
jgi:hypothetical protein